MNADRIIRDLVKVLQQQVSFDRGPLTMAQQGHIARALAATTGGAVPDVVFIEERSDSDVLYAICWIHGSAFGVLNVMDIDPNYSGPPTTEGWVRPVSELSRVDLRVVVQPDQLVPSDVDIRLDATIIWRDGQMPVGLDGTLSGNHHARDAANALIRTVLNRVEVGRQTSSVTVDHNRDLRTGAVAPATGAAQRVEARWKRPFISPRDG